MSQNTDGQSTIARVYASIARVSLYLVIFLIPIVFFPWTTDVLEVNKQTVLITFVSVAVIAWLGMMVAGKQFFVKRSWIFVAAGAFLLSALVSSVLSLAPVVSWVGQGVQEYTSFISLLAFVLFFIVGAHFLSETKVQRMVFALALTASAIVGVVGVFAAFGAPFLDTVLVGTPNALGLYLASMAILGSGLWLVAGDGAGERSVMPAGAVGGVVRVAITVTVISALIVMLALDFWALWAAAIAGLIVVFTFALLRAEEFPHTSYFVLPMLMLVVSVLFLFLPSVFPSKFPVEIAPSASATRSIAGDTLADTSWLFGSGPGTFVLDYTKHKVPEVNATRLWDTRFDRGNAHIVTMLATFGIVGVTLFLVFALSVAAASIAMLVKERAHDEWKMTFVAFAAWTVLFVGLFVYSSNMTLTFLFWLLSAILVSQVGAQAKHVAFSQSPRGALLTTFLFVLVSVGLLTLAFVSASRYASEIAFARAVAADRSNAPIDEVIEHLDTAASLNKWNDMYYRNLSSALIKKTAEMLQDENVDQAQLQNIVSLTINAARRAVEISPNYVVNWATVGDVYREFILLAENAENLSAAAYERAIELAPSNPKYYTAQARVYLIIAEELGKYLENDDASVAQTANQNRDDALTRAVERLEEAVALKSDYAPAHYYLALAYERQGNLEESTARMEILRDRNRLDVGIHFQLGLLYLKQGMYADAQTSFETAIDIAPNYSNARWYLAAVHEANRDLEAAIDQIEVVADLNPGNALVEQRLERLRDGIVQEQLPDPVEEGEGTEVTEVEGEAPLEEPSE